MEPPASTGTRRPRCMNAKTKQLFLLRAQKTLHCNMPNLHAYVSAANTASAAEDSTAAKSADNSSQSSAGEPGEAPTHMKPKRKRSKRPEVHVHKPTRSYSLVQQQQLIHEFVYAEIEYEKGGKTTILDPTNLKYGILFFWDEVVKNAALLWHYSLTRLESLVVSY